MTITTEDAKMQAQTIISQLGGSRRLSMMIGASLFAFDEKGVHFSFKGFRPANKCIISITSMDTYDLVFMKYSPSKGTCTETKKYDGIYCDQLIELFEGYTKLYLSM